MIDEGAIASPHRLAELATSPVNGGSQYTVILKAFPAITGKGDRVSGGRGTKKGLLHEVCDFVQQPLFLCSVCN